MAKCFYCDRKAEYLCDFVLKHEKRLTKPLYEGMSSGELLDALLTCETTEWQTCDRPLCENHRCHEGTMFIDGDKENTCIESVDMCPGHAGMGGHKPDKGWCGRDGGPGRGGRMAA